MTMQIPQPASLGSVFGMSPDQDALRDAVRTVLRERAGLSVTARTGFSTAKGQQLWSVLTDLGVPGMLVPTSLGGSGLNYIDVVVALEEAGRVLLPAPLAATVTAVAAVLAAEDAPAAERLLPGIAAGGLRATVALSEAADPVGDQPATTAEHAGGSWSLTGAKELVLAAHEADVFVVSATTAAGPGLFTVETTAAGVVVEKLPSLDLTRSFARVELDHAVALPLGVVGAPGLVERVADLAIVFLSAEAAGATQQALDMSVEYATTRFQYDRAIGSFQAIKHRCADMLIETEYARSAVYYAAWAATSEPDELGVLAGVLKSTAAEASLFVAENMIQIHGGIGFTWEHPAHLFYKRALSDRLLFGGPEIHQDRMASALGF